MGSVKLAVYPGTFDPITLGHLNVAERACKLFDRLVIAVGINSVKEPWFTPEERCEMIREAARERGLENIETTTYTGLTVSFAKKLGARVVIRGVRPLADIPAELTMMMANPRARVKFSHQRDRRRVRVRREIAEKLCSAKRRGGRYEKDSGKKSSRLIFYIF